MRYLLAHDLGTSGNKATLFAETGELIASSLSVYKTDYFNNNWAEQDPDDWWLAVCSSSRDLIKKSKIAAADIASISFSGHMMGCLCLDDKGNPLRRHILWADQRAQKQARQINQKLGPEKFYRITGHRSNASYGLQKLMWVRDNEPQIYQKTQTVVNAKDWVVFKMTGNLLSEYSDACSMTALDLENRQWSDEILAAARIDKSKLPQLVPSTHTAGTLTAKAADETGLIPGIPVVMGGGDGLCATIGAGCVKEGLVHACIGSSAWVSFASKKPLFDKEMRTFNWIHIVPGLVCPCGTMQSAGAAYSWMKDQLAVWEKEQSEKSGKRVYALIDEIAAESEPGSNGVLFMPYLIGERSPRWHSDAKGAFIGLKMETKRADLFRSVLEGVAMNLAIIIDVYREYGYAIDKINLIGGGAKSDLWCQIMADIWNSQINKLNYLDEATSMGAAVTGGVGVGLYKDFDAIETFIKPAKLYLPNDRTSDTYQHARDLFESLYQALAPVFTKF